MCTVQYPQGLLKPLPQLSIYIFRVQSQYVFEYSTVLQYLLYPQAKRTAVLLWVQQCTALGFSRYAKNGKGTQAEKGKSKKGVRGSATSLCTGQVPLSDLADSTTYYSCVVVKSCIGNWAPRWVSDLHLACSPAALIAHRLSPTVHSITLPLFLLRYPCTDELLTQQAAF